MEKNLNRQDALNAGGGGKKPAEEAEPEPKGNGEPRKNSGEKPGEDADKPRGGTG